MPTSTLTVAPIHCALCRARLVAAVESLGGRVVTATIGRRDLVVDTDLAELGAVVAAVLAIEHAS